MLKIRKNNTNNKILKHDENTKQTLKTQKKSTLTNNY